MYGTFTETCRHAGIPIRDLHGDGDGGNPAESVGMGTVVAGILQECN